MRFLILGIAAALGAVFILLPRSAAAAIAENPAPPQDDLTIAPDPDNAVATYTGVADMTTQTDQNMIAFLTLIRQEESNNNYASLVGGGSFSNFSDHPANLGWKGVKIKGVTTHAAGAYQFQPRTWNALRTRLGLPDFSPASQDAAAIEDIREHKNATILIESGQVEAAMFALRKEWESLDRIISGNYNRVSVADAKEIFANSGGVLA